MLGMLLWTLACLIYAAVNFALFAIRSHAGSPEVKNGQYVLQDHGRVMREITRQEYEARQMYIVRGFSGHWMFFSIAAITILAASKRMMWSGSAARAA